MLKVGLNVGEIGLKQAGRVVGIEQPYSRIVSLGIVITTRNFKELRGP